MTSRCGASASARRSSPTASSRVATSCIAAARETRSSGTRWVVPHRLSGWSGYQGQGGWSG